MFQNTRADATNYSAHFPPSSLTLDGGPPLMSEQRNDERSVTVKRETRRVLV